MASLGGIWAPTAQRLLRYAATNTVRMLRSKIANASRPAWQGELQNVSARTTNPTGRQPIHPAALLRQQRAGRWHSTTAAQSAGQAFKRFFGGSSQASARAGPRLNRADFPSSNTSRRVAQLPGRAPFASALRPNLTGGAMPRTQGGYGLGGHGARYFSHTPAAPAQVVQNVSAAMRAFCLSGQKARFDGVTARGEKRYRSVSALEDDALNKMSAAPRCVPGSFVDFHLAPTVTALSPLIAAFPFPSATPGGIRSESATAATLCADGFIDDLSADFARALKDLSAVMNDIKLLSGLGDLPVMLERTNILRVRFPGVDGTTVESLCADLGIRRGVVGEDPDFEESAGAPVALRFPFAPDADKTVTSPGGSLRSLTGHEVDDAFLDEMEENPWMLSDPEEGYESMSPPLSSGEHCSDDFEGLEGIYRFMEECDRVRGQFGRGS